MNMQGLSNDRTHGLQYNSSREDLIISEYGRHIQKMVAHCKTLESKEERNKMANAIIAIMGQLFPHLRDVDDFTHKLWDHLFIMANFDLDVDSPYPKPEAAQFQEKPEKVNYPDGEVRFGHYGGFIPKFIKLATDMEPGEQRQALTANIVNLMKRTYIQWNKDNVKDEVLLEHLHRMSDGKLELKDLEKIRSVSELQATRSKKKKQHNSKNQKNKHKKRY